MTVFSRIAALAAVVTTLTAVGATAASAQSNLPPAQPTVLSVERYETPVDGWSGWLVWSRRGPDGTYTLLARNPSGDAVTLPIAPQSAPIDASIGPGPDGRALIVYSRCSKASPSQSTGCDVYRIDPVTGNGGLVPAASHPGRDERHPTVWGDRIAFSVSVGRSTSRAGVAIADLDRTTTASRPTIFGPRTERLAGKKVPLRRYGPRGIDLRGGRLAFSWQAQGRTDRWSLHLHGPRNATRQLLSERTTSTVVRSIGRPVIGRNDVIVPVLRTGGESTSEIARTTFTGKQRWRLRGGFTAAQTERYGAAQTAVARTDDRDLVVVRRLASDGRWACAVPSSPEGGGCELLRYADAGRAWIRVRGATATS